MPQFNIRREVLVEQTEERLRLIQERLNEIDAFICEIDKEVSEMVKSNSTHTDSGVIILRELRDAVVAKIKKPILRKKTATEIFLRKHKS